MLEHIIPSKARRKILKLFFDHLTEPFYLRRIVREINEEVNAVKRELDILTEENLLIKEKRLNKIFYSLNKNYLFFDEFMRIFVKQSALGNLIYSNLAKIGKVNFIALSYKYVKKMAINEDEVYLLCVGILVVPELTAIIAQAEKEFGREINYTVMTEEEFVFRKKNNDPFIWRFLKQPKIMLIGSEEDLMK